MTTAGAVKSPFYASGSKGPEARADGEGGLLARGWYHRVDGVLCGPFTTERKAQKNHDIPAQGSADDANI